MTTLDRDLAFVTGATGFVGSHLVAALLGQGRDVVAFVRHPERADHLSHPRLRVVRGDVRTIAAGDLPSVATVFHLAAVRQTPGTSLELLAQVNREGSAAVAQAAIGAGARRLVNLSTAMILGPSRGLPADEESAITEFAQRQPYLASKIAALASVDRIAGEELNVVTLLPTIIYGPDHPSHPNVITQHLRRLAGGRIAPRFPGWSRKRNLVHVADVVAGILAAEATAPSGSRMILGGEDISPDELHDLVLDLAGRRGLRVPLPEALAVVAARGADLMLRRRGSFELSARLEMLRAEWTFSSARAVSTIGYTWRGVREGVAETLGLRPKTQETYDHLGT